MSRWAARLPWLAAAGFLVAAALWLHLDRRIPREAFVAGSVQNTGPEGLSLAQAYLKRTGRAVSSLGRPVERAFLPRNAVLLRIGARGKGGEPLRLLTPEEETWIRGGGRLVLALAGPYGGLTTAAGAPELSKVFPLWEGVRRLDPPVRRTLSGAGLADAHALWAAGDGVAAARKRIGAGDLLLLSFPEIFHNRGLATADHLALLEALAGAGRPVWFDEHAHGMETAAGVLEILAAWGLGPLLVLGALAAATAFWRARTRLGPAEDDARETRVEALDVVDSLALLYGRALGRRQAVEMYRQALERAVSARTGLRGEALAGRVKALLGGGAAGEAGRRGDLSVPGFERSLRTLNEAFRRLDHEQRRGRGRALEARRRRA